MPASKNDKIAIIGGGIAGMYCAYILGKQGHTVTLYEATERLGGRIRTVRLKSGSDKTHAEIKEYKRGEPPTNAEGLTGSLADLEKPARANIAQPLPAGLIACEPRLEDSADLDDEKGAPP